MKIVTYRFSGISPLLMTSTRSIGDSTVPVIRLGTQPNAGDIERVAESLAYRDEDGTLCFPTEAFRSALLYGCKGQKLKGSRGGPAGLFQGMLFTIEEMTTLTDERGKPLKTYEIARHTGVNRNAKPPARVPLFRPMVDPWFTTVPFELDEDFAPPNLDEVMRTMLDIWNRGGRMSGVGAFRPEKKGRFGRFSVERVS